MEVVEATASKPIPYPSAARQRAVDAVAAYLKMLRAYGLTRRGVAGDGGGNVNVPGRVNFVYARLGAGDGDVCEARNITLINMAEDDPILLARERPGALGGWLVVDWYGTGTPDVVECEVCTLTYQSQTDFRAGAEVFGLAGSSVAVRGHYAYVVKRCLEDGGGTVTESAELLTYDLSDPDAPSLVDTFDFGVALTVTSCGIYGSDLYASGFDVDSALFSDEQDKHLYKFDLTMPDAPSLTASNTSARLYPSWDIFVQGGAAYLVGYTWVTGHLLDELIVYDDTLTEIGGLSGNYLDHKPVFCNGHAFVGTGSSPFPDETNAELAEIDLSDPTAPSLVWTDTGGARGMYALVNLDDTQYLYAAKFGGGWYRYDVSTPASISRTAITGTLSNAHYGWQVVGTCLVSMTPSAATVWDITDSLAPVETQSESAPIATDTSTDGRDAVVYDDAGTVYLCGVGIPIGSEDGEYLTVMTN